MSIEKDFATLLSAGDVTIDRRDIEMLDAIDEHGSLHEAADALGRSYARLQNRVVEIEDAVGRITDRQRGGADGGGTTLTGTGRELRRRFDRHETELDGVAAATESVLTGTVGERSGELATVDTPAGDVLALVPDGAIDVEVSVRSDAVVLTDPAETPGPQGTSLRNRFTGTVERIDSGDAIANVTVSLGDDVTLQALITGSSLERLALAPGRTVDASFKATGARATRLDPDRDEA